MGKRRRRNEYSKEMKEGEEKGEGSKLTVT